MQINLTWDLFIIIFFVVIIAYSFIIGKNQTLKVILSSYIAILAADAIGNLIQKYFVGENPIINIFTVESAQQATILMKIVVFVFTVVILTIKGGFEVNISKEGSPMIGVFMTMIYGVLSSGLIISTILIFISGISMFQSGSGEIVNSAIKPIYDQSYLIKLMILNYNLWFSLPALAFVFSSFSGKGIDIDIKDDDD